MEKQYIINESELTSLITDSYKLQCLELEGVKDWKRYLINAKDFLGDFKTFFKKQKMN